MAPSADSSDFLSICDELDGHPKEDAVLSKFARQQQSNASENQGGSFGDFSANEEHKATLQSTPKNPNVVPQQPATATPKKVASHIGQQLHSPSKTQTTE